jgi:hypothetical protein
MAGVVASILSLVLDMPRIVLVSSDVPTQVPLVLEVSDRVESFQIPQGYTAAHLVRGTILGTSTCGRLDCGYARSRMNQTVPETSTQHRVETTITSHGREFGRNFAISKANTNNQMLPIAAPVALDRRRQLGFALFAYERCSFLVFLSTVKHLRVSGMHCISVLSSTQDNSLSDQSLPGNAARAIPQT